jgi:hypothetical protein
VLLSSLPSFALPLTLQLDRCDDNDGGNDRYTIRRHIADTLLTLACPRCTAAFVDFAGCFALTCHRCSCGFCGWCLQDCGADAHSHVSTCKVNGAAGSLFGTLAAFTQAHQLRRSKMVRDYLATVADQPPGLRARVVAACAKDFADLGIDVSGAAAV